MNIGMLQMRIVKRYCRTVPAARGRESILVFIPPNVLQVSIKFHQHIGKKLQHFFELRDTKLSN